MTWVEPSRFEEPDQRERDAVRWGKELRDPDKMPVPPEGRYIQIREWMNLPVQVRLTIYQSIAFPVAAGKLDRVDNLSLDVLSYGIFHDQEALDSAGEEMRALLNYGTMFGFMKEQGDLAAIDLLNRRKTAEGPLTMNPALGDLVRSEFEFEEGGLSKYIRDEDPQGGTYPGALWLGLTAVTGEDASAWEQWRAEANKKMEDWPEWKALAYGAMHALGGLAGAATMVFSLGPETSEEQQEIAAGIAADQQAIAARRNAYQEEDVTRIGQWFNSLIHQTLPDVVTPADRATAHNNWWSSIRRFQRPGITTAPGAAVAEGEAEFPSLEEVEALELDVPYVGVQPGFENVTYISKENYPFHIGPPKRVVRDPVYRVNDIDEALEAMTDQQLAAFEERALRAGLIQPSQAPGGQSFVRGSRTGEHQRRAMESVMGMANRTSGAMDWQIVLSDLAVLGDEQGIYEDLEPPEPVFPRRVYQPLDYASIASQIVGDGHRLVGRQLENWEIELLAQEMSAAHRADFEAEEALREQEWEISKAAAEGVDISADMEEIQDVDWQARYSSAFDKHFAPEINRLERMDEAQTQQRNLFDSFNIGAGLIGR